MQPQLPAEVRALHIMLHYRQDSIFGRDREAACIDICISYHPVPARYMSVFNCHWNQPYILWDQDVDWCSNPMLFTSRYGFCRPVLRTCQGVVTESTLLPWDLTKRTGLRKEYFQEKLLSLCPYLEDHKKVRKGYSSSQSIASFESDDSEYIQLRLECLLMRTNWRPRSKNSSITHARLFTSTIWYTKHGGVLKTH